jgi:glycogen(starch) synthase
MKLLIYTHSFAPNIGGIETIVVSLAQGLAERQNNKGRREFDLTLVTQTPAADFDDRALPYAVVRRPGLGRLWRLICESDVVHLAGPALAPLLLARLACKPSVVEHHGFQAICPNGQLVIEPSGAPCPGHFMAGHHAMCLRCQRGHGWPGSLRLWLLTFVRRLLAKQALANVTPTEWLARLLKLPKAVCVPHGLEPPPTQIVTAAPPASQPLMIAFQGRLVSTKGAKLLLEAAEILHAQYPNFRLLIVGDGPERPALERQAHAGSLAGRVEFTGNVPSSQLDSVLSRTEVVVVPSLGGEVFGLVVAEAMLRGTPVVTSNLGALAEVLGDGGLTFPVGDASALAQQLSKFLSDRTLARRLGELARARVLRTYARRTMIEGHARIYEQMARN